MTNVNTSRAIDQQSTAEVLQLEADREICARLVDLVFPRGLKRWGRSQYAISRARQGSTDNPMLRMTTWIRTGRRAGMTRVQANLIVAHIQSVIEQEFSEPVAFVAAARAEQAHDGIEDVHQMASLTDPAALADYIDAAKLHAAAQLTAIAAAEREVKRRTR